jgi:hypothetical protein
LKVILINFLNKKKEYQWVNNFDIYKNILIFVKELIENIKTW